MIFKFYKARLENSTCKLVNKTFFSVSLSHFFAEKKMLNIHNLLYNLQVQICVSIHVCKIYFLVCQFPQFTKPFCIFFFAKQTWKIVCNFQQCMFRIRQKASYCCGMTRYLNFNKSYFSMLQCAQLLLR